MRVKMLVGLSGPACHLQPGDIYDTDEAEAGRLIAARFALPFVEVEVETATVEPVQERRAPDEQAPRTRAKRKAK